MARRRGSFRRLLSGGLGRARVYKDLANERAPQQLFWVIKNGINMTGMPSFGAIKVPDHEIRTIVAFVKNLPSVRDDDFRAWTARH